MAVAALTIDTLQYAKKLQKAGFTAKQAEVQAEAIQEQTINFNKVINDGLATKRDTREIELKIKELEASIKRLEASTKLAISEMGYKITVRLGSMIVGAVAVISLLMKMLNIH